VGYMHENMLVFPRTLSWMMFHSY